MAEENENPPEDRLIFQCKVDDIGVILSIARSNVLASGWLEITQEQYEQANGHLSAVRLMNGAVVPYTAPTPPMVLAAADSISRRQFFTQLALDAVITFEEAEATTAGTIPSLLNAIISQISNPVERFKAGMLARGATEFQIDQPLVAYVATTLGWDKARLTKLWQDASRL